MLVPLLGRTVIGYFVTICLPACMVLAVWGLARRSPWLLMASSLACMFSTVAQAPAVGLLGLPLPFLLFALGFWRFLPGSLLRRIVLTVLAGCVYVVLAFQLVAILIT